MGVLLGLSLPVVIRCAEEEHGAQRGVILLRRLRPRRHVQHNGRQVVEECLLQLLKYLGEFNGKNPLVAVPLRLFMRSPRVVQSITRVRKKCFSESLPLSQDLV